MKEKPFNYVFVLYDVKNTRCNKIFKICKKYLNHHQNSVFRGQISKSNYITFKNELKKIIHKDEDFVTIIKLFNENYLQEETIGTCNKNTEDLFI